MTKLYEIISPYRTGTGKLVEKGEILSGARLGAQVGELRENGNIKDYEGPPLEPVTEQPSDTPTPKDKGK